MLNQWYDKVIGVFGHLTFDGRYGTDGKASLMHQPEEVKRGIN